MSIQELYCKGARVWVRDPDLVWKGGELKHDYKDGGHILDIELEDGTEKTLKLKGKDDLPPLRNPDILIGENDLTSLSYLHEPAVLFNLHERFIRSNAIYTYCGIVLVAINPYQQLPLYGEDVIYAYRGQDMGSMDPHIFAVAEEAFRRMSRFDQNQSIIVSGESGAGKTVSAKYAMRYFATVGGSAAETQIEKKVLASNPVMEAMGNAKTTRNDNSSRFGKYIEISFNTQNHIIGANMRTYLLEKSRVVFQAEEERNYHIFYQLCSSCHLPELASLRLGHPDEFFYTNQGESPVVNGIDDAVTYEETKDAFSLLGFQDVHIQQIFRVVGAVLHFGNVEIQPGDHESSKLEKDNENLTVLCDLLGIEEVQMKKWLCNRKIITVREILTKPLTMMQAVISRDALAKKIYSQLFVWIVAQINKIIQATSKAKSFIGVLDIYGFEMFEINSFEQFCINYANEKLQQQFTQHVFKLEQEEYIKEQIEWSFIDFYDNQPCIDLIENKLGILDLLDEECMMPKGSDDNWCSKLYKSLTDAKHFSKPRMSRTAFIVHHFADKVQYQSDGFVEKNRDNVNEEHLNILRASQFEFVADLFRVSIAPASSRRAVIKPGSGPAVKGQKSFKSSVGTQFRESLKYLMEKLNATTPHYVRCIKPNDTKTSFEFEPKRAVEQLRACGVLETIRISAAGYPSRWTYGEFYSRYRALMKPNEYKRKDVRGTSEKTLTRLIPDPDKYQFGKTKIFFRAGQVAYLEKLRADKLRAACILMQKTVRGWVQRKKYVRLLKTAVIAQRIVRGFLARRLTRHMRRTSAATCIQRRWRGYSQRQKYLHVRSAVVTVQAFTRGMYGRRRYTRFLREARATTIQKSVRGWQARQKYRRVRQAIVLIQCCTRRLYAKRELKKLKIEARSVEHMKKLQKGMENKVISLQQKVNELTKERDKNKDQEATIEKLRTQVKSMEHTQAESSTLNKRLLDLEQENARLRQELLQANLEKSTLNDEMGRVLQEHKQERDQQEAESEKLRKELVEKENLYKELEEKSQEELKLAVEAAQDPLAKELAAEKAQHQKLLQDYARLEQRCDNLKEDLEASQHPPEQFVQHVRTDSSEGGESGYGTLSTNQVEDVEGVEEEIQEQGQEKASMNMNVFLKLQHRVRDLEKEKRQFETKLEEKDYNSRTRTSTMEIDLDVLNAQLRSYKEENAKLKSDLEALRTAVNSATAEDDIPRVLTRQVSALNDENHKYRQEIIKLKTDSTNQQRRLEKQMNGDDSPDGGARQKLIEEEIESLAEDGNLSIAYKSLKTTNQILEKEIQALKKNHEVEVKELKEALDGLKTDNDRQQEIIGQSLKMTPEARINQTVQHEISRLTNENLDLMEQNEYLEKQVKKLKKQLKMAYRRVTSTLDTSSATATSFSESPASSHQSAPANIGDGTHIAPANVRMKEREILGMLEYRQEDDTKIIKTIIIDFHPKNAECYLPGLPAYIIFMCIRHADDINDDRKVKALLTAVINGIKKTVKKHFEDFEFVSFWLTNTVRLMHTLKQYSGEENFSNQNISPQNDHCLRNFDLSEYRQVMNDLGVHIYQMLVHIIENKLQPMIVPAMLESDSAGLSTKPSGMRGRSASVSSEYDQKISIDSLIKQLTTFLTVMNMHGTDPEVVKQVIKQSFYLVTASTINNILLRKDMCHWSKGVQIRYNMSELEEWLRMSKVYDANMEETLEPLVQIAQLLQVKKRTEDDVRLICDTCTKLTTTQVVKILNLYTPDEYEKKTEVAFIRKVQAKLAGRMDSRKEAQLLIDTKYTFPVTFPYNPSSVLLNEITIPDSFKLDCIKRV